MKIDKPEENKIKLNNQKVKKLNASKKFNRKKIFRLSFLGLMIFFTLGAFAIFILTLSLPDISKLKTYIPNESSIVYDINNNIIANLHEEENRTVVQLADIPKHVQEAVIAMEDERFFTHTGVDIKATARAVISIFDPTDRLVKGGGSTITQQLVRNIFLTRKISLYRKVSEILLAIKIERNFTKDQILELYLNEVYWGHNAYGVESAAKLFFGKSAKDLNLSEASLIGGLLSSPEYYSPYKSIKLAKWRQSLTLANMVRNNFITQEEADAAKNKVVYLVGLKNNYSQNFPYFTSYVTALLGDKYGQRMISRGGLKIFTTLDADAQALAEKIIAKEIAKLKSRNITQGALVSIDPTTGYIKALVGGIDYYQSQFNRVTQAKRQPGSSFKPFVYLTAFKEGVVTPTTVVNDEPIHYPNWSPRNYDGKFHGSMTITQAVKKSINTIAVKTLENTGINKVIMTAKELGIESPLNPELSLALGTSEVSPLELASAYGVFATGGKRVRFITPILKVEDKEGNILEDFTKPELDQVYDSDAINILNQVLKAVVSPGGSGAAAMLPGKIVAGKTGTTSNYRDSWFAGYVPKMVTVVWVGNDNGSKMIGASGGGICAPIWKKYMSVVTRKFKSEDFPRGDKLKNEEIIPLENNTQPVTDNPEPIASNIESAPEQSSEPIKIEDSDATLQIEPENSQSEPLEAQEIPSDIPGQNNQEQNIQPSAESTPIPEEQQTQPQSEEKNEPGANL